MLTGDNRARREAIAREVGDRRRSGRVLPEDKADEVARLQAMGAVVAMVGDGINDAPALARPMSASRIGTGTDVAMEAADITLVSGDLQGVVTAIALSRATRAATSSRTWRSPSATTPSASRWPRDCCMP